MTLKAAGSAAIRFASLAALANFAMALPAAAHHPMGGQLPSNFMEGFLSGIGHPVIGVDHLAFVIAIGIASAFMSNSYRMPLFFVGGTVLGCLAYSLSGIAMPFQEFAIAASVFVLGAFVMSGRSMNPTIGAALFALAGLFHGSAYAGEILGVESTPLIAYLIGFSVIQFAIAAGTTFVVRELSAASQAISTQPRLAGAMLAGVGLTFLIENLEAVAFAAM